MMKRMSRSFALLLALLLLLLSACRQEPAPVEPTPPDDPPVVEPVEPTPPDDPPVVEPVDPAPTGAVTVADETVSRTVEDGQGQPLLSLALTVPMPEGMAEAQQYYTDWLSDTAYYCEQDAEDAAAARETQISLGNDFLPYAYESDYEVLRNDGVLLSFYRTYYTSTGGVHPSIRTMAETFVVETGAMLVLDDLFEVPAETYLARLRELILPQMDAFEQTYGEGSYYENAREELTTLYDPRDFALSDDSLLVFFPSYVLAPYAAGIQEFSIPLSELADVLHPQWVA